MRHIDQKISNPDRNLDNSSIKVFVLHEDVLSGVRAVAVLGQLSDQFGAEPAFDSQTWKFESLSHPELWEQASAQAIAADMIVFSAGGRQLLPSHVRDLFEDAVFRKAGTPAAVVALLDREHDSSSEPPPLCAYLREISETAGLDFFCNTGRWHFASGIEPVVDRMESRPPILEPTGVATRGWGIND